MSVVSVCMHLQAAQSRMYNESNCIVYVSLAVIWIIIIRFFFWIENIHECKQREEARQEEGKIDKMRRRKKILAAFSAFLFFSLCKTGWENNCKFYQREIEENFHKFNYSKFYRTFKCFAPKISRPPEILIIH